MSFARRIVIDTGVLVSAAAVRHPLQRYAQGSGRRQHIAQRRNHFGPLTGLEAAVGHYTTPTSFPHFADDPTSDARH